METYICISSGGSRIIMFRLGLDIHGVIDHMPYKMRKLANTVLYAGGEVHIITGGDYKRAKIQLDKIDFPYTTLFSIQDFLNIKCEHLNIGINLIDGKYLYTDELWDSAKAMYCKENEIDIHIDDSLHYREHFETPFLHFERRKYLE